MSRYNQQEEDHLAYGDYNQGQSGDGERGFIGDVGKRIFGKNQEQSSTSGHQKPSGGMSFFNKIHEAVHDIGSEVKEKLTGQNKPEGQHQQQQGGYGQQSAPGPAATAHPNSNNRFESFAPERTGNDAKWYVDACGYMWAVSIALEQAKESIWILDWWLSPELYLRRPPAKFEQYRVDRMLHAAAERGVKVNIMVYKEVTQALTLSSSHTKHALEDLHPNIAVFRHPDHLPDGQVVASNLLSSLSNLSLSAASASKLPTDSLKAIYGVHEGTVLYWAHHEKLCLVDGRTAFMGGLDLCYGRWDTNQHSIADAHPGNLDNIVFPGQDYNNARIMDFDDVVHWQNNKLDRTKSSRMGWSDISLCVSGPVVQDLKTHFTQRWNFIYDEKYNTRKDARYIRLPDPQTFQPPPTQAYRGVEEGEDQRGFEESERGFDGEEGGDGERGLFGREGGFRDKLKHRVQEGFQQGGYGGGHQQQQGYQQHQQQGGYGSSGAHNGTSCQITRSSAKWSHGITLEHSIQNAYCEVIRNSEHFVYIENQFFITATGDKQKPVKNQIGAAIVERILRAARNGEQYKIFVMMPAVPAFAGDLRADDALGTRAIMEFQYNSINRGGNSIYEMIAREGFNPMDYIRFYNLRSYDRINASGVMAEVEQKTGVPYEEARKEHDVAYGGVYANEPPPPQQYQAYRPPQSDQPSYGQQEQGYGQQQGGYVPYNQQPVYEMDASSRGIGDNSAYQQYQEGAQQVGDHKGLGSGKWDSVASCYMLGGEDIRNVPWEGGAMDEIDAFVSEELYIHSKLLIADDRIVICGSANLNDRSQVGDHDSEIAIVINDPTPCESTLNGRQWRASKFAASLRRQIFRKHLGLIPPQDYERPDQNYEPIGVPNNYDWGSREDALVVDPLNEEFVSHWYRQAKTNTEAFGRVFHPVPFDGVRNWKQYDEYYERFFKEEGKGDDKKPSKYKWGHVVAEDFQNVGEVKEVLSQIKGTLVEMPLLFLKEEDIAKEGLGLNAFTEDVYT